MNHENDDEFPSFIGSGKKFHVSVSEHTGNAKTPKNIVTSHEEETRAKVRSYESMDGDFDPLAFHTHDEQNLRLDKIDKESGKGPETLKAPNDNAAAENLQTIHEDSHKPNKQSLPKGDATGANKQSIQTTHAKDNLQAVSTGNLQDNHQGSLGEIGRAHV